MKIHGQAFLEFVGILLSWNPSLIICRTITGRQSLPVDQGGGKEHKKPLAKTRPPTHNFRQPCSEKDFSDFQWCHVVGHGDVGDGEGWRGAQRVGHWWDHRSVQLGGPKLIELSHRTELQRAGWFKFPSQGSDASTQGDHSKETYSSSFLGYASVSVRWCKETGRQPPKSRNRARQFGPPFNLSKVEEIFQVHKCGPFSDEISLAGDILEMR